MMKHEIPGSRVFRLVGRRLALLSGLILAMTHGHPSFAADARKTEGSTPAHPRPKCEKTLTGIDRLICLEPTLAARDAAIGPAFHDYLERAARPADREARTADQRLWLDGRAMACPAAARLQSDATARDGEVEGAVACLSRIYEQRLAVLSLERNAAAWPRIRFRPTIVEGAGTKLCEDLERDLAASFLGRGLFVNPLGEREIGFVPMPGLGNAPIVQRADIDAYNLGKPFPVLQWISDNGGARPPMVEYRAFASSQELLSAIGRGVEPLEPSVRAAAHSVIDIDRLPHPDPGRLQTGPRAAFARASNLSIDEMPRFFRYEDHVYLTGPMQPLPGRPGDLGIYRLYDRRGCAAFACSMRTCRQLICPTTRWRTPRSPHSSARQGRCCRPAGCAPASATRRAPSAIKQPGDPGSWTGAGRWQTVSAASSSPSTCAIGR
jgi:uncharacterized protein YecT (DUF1311 family)